MVNVQSPPKLPQGATPPSRSRYSRKVVAALVLVIVGALVGIGVLLSVDDNSSSNSAPLPTSEPGISTPSTADPDADTKAAIIAAYRQSYDAIIAVGSDPTGQPTDPRLEKHTIGNALLASQASIDRLRRAGHVLRGTIELHPKVVELTADTAVVEDCSVDRLSVVNAATGEVVTPADPEPRGGKARATYKLLNGVWMQNSFKDLKQPCVPPAS